MNYVQIKQCSIHFGIHDVVLCSLNILICSLVLRYSYLQGRMHRYQKHHGLGAVTLQNILESTASICSAYCHRIESYKQQQAKKDTT